jgi:predicted aspartyl protease
MNATKNNSFTKEYNETVKAIKTYCNVSSVFNPEYLSRPNFKMPLRIEFVALWDTGATRSVISENVVKKLGLKPIGKRIVYHANGQSTVNSYDINIFLEDNIGFHALEVTQGILSDMDVLIGMDIILNGDFAITTSLGKPKFSFQIPSTHDIDFTKE